MRGIGCSAALKIAPVRVFAFACSLAPPCLYHFHGDLAPPPCVKQQQRRLLARMEVEWCSRPHSALFYHCESLSCDIPEHFPVLQLASMTCQE